jgi:hypothetical protein
MLLLSIHQYRNSMIPLIHTAKNAWTGDSSSVSSSSLCSLWHLAWSTSSTYRSIHIDNFKNISHIAYEKIIRCSYSFYASYGDLDLECPTRLALGVIKDFMSFPISIPLRDKMKSRIHSAWEEVKRSKVLVNINALTESLKPNPDDALVSYQMFIRMLDSKIFQVYMKEFTPIGKRGIYNTYSRYRSLLFSVFVLTRYVFE